ncbi:MAG: SCO family protein [Woeseiaceae bacterium]|nr:SCO family protein [Woeseiaceae bacterium]
MQLELRASDYSPATMNLRNLIIGVISGIALAAGFLLAMNVLQAPTENVRSATILPATMELPEFALIDHQGTAADQSFFEGQWDLVFFGFTHCPDVCPLTLQILQAAKKALGEKQIDPLPRIVLVSVDPERDTPEVLGAYINAFGDNNAGLTGELQQLRRLTSALGIYFEKVSAGENNYSIDHTSVVLVIDPQGRFHSLFSSPHRIEDYAHDLPIILRR